MIEVASIDSFNEAASMMGQNEAASVSLNERSLMKYPKYDKNLTGKVSMRTGKFDEVASI